ncbi:MAG: hypothetical protein Q8M34_07625 [Thermodesulfovibrionales bacterium]|nr:hypothetical protein [Thermodesulfovibrionales bacterium]
MKTLSAIIIGLLTAVSALAAETASDVVARMTDKTASWEVRCAAEDSLINMHPQDVLAVLLPHIGKGMPSSTGIWNSGGREMDKRAPVEWHIFYAVTRSWNHQVGSLPKDSVGTFLLMLLKRSPTANARSRILTEVTHRWVPEAESPVAAILKAPDENLDVRTTAALVLILHGAGDYHDLLLEYAKTGCFADQKRWFDLLSDPRNKKRTGADPRVVQMGFNLILTDRKLSPNYIHGAYFLAIKTGDYVGREFQPDQNKPEYQGENGLAESFFADTVKNAIEWWAANKTRIEKELPTRQIQRTR